MEQILGWLGNIGFLLGAYLIAQKNIHGFTMQIVANLLYLIQASMMCNLSLFWLSLTLILINLYGIIKWAK